MGEHVGAGVGGGALKQADRRRHRDIHQMNASKAPGAGSGHPTALQDLWDEKAGTLLALWDPHSRGLGSYHVSNWF